MFEIELNCSYDEIYKYRNNERQSIQRCKSSVAMS